ncbi:uncharacterized protein LOC135805308 [Sycon ciliatum]|uniref:uncharacterized protein LOC135805308 n=1 Tax=Sycon ciliatum TaxID=27933 RepID=UPI0031F691AD
MLVKSVERTMCTAASAASVATTGSITSLARRRFEDHERCRLSEDRIRPHQPAAVLVPLFLNHADDKLSVLLTQRSAMLKHHSGEVALPGGRYDEGDESAMATALRESSEEVGLQKHQVEVCTELPPHFARNQSSVVPVVGFIPENFPPRIQEAEVDAVFRAPLEMFLSSENHSSKYIDFHANRFLMHSFNYVDPEHGNRAFRIWGFTAQLLITVASIAFNRVPDFDCLLMHYGSSGLPNHATLLEKRSSL